MKGTTLYLDRSEKEESKTSSLVDTKKELQKLNRIIQKIKKGLTEDSSTDEMADLLKMIFDENLDLNSKYGIAGKVAKKIESGMTCAEAFHTTDHALREKYKQNSMIAPGFIDLLNAFDVALNELAGSKTINQILSKAKGPTIICTEKVIPADFEAIRKHNKKHPEKKVIGFVRRDGTLNDHIDTLCRQNKLNSVLMKDPHFIFSKVKDHSLALVLSEEGQGEGRDLIFNPEESIIKQAEEEIELSKYLNRGIPVNLHSPITKCGEKIILTYACSDLEQTHPENEKLDVGLLRTELLFNSQGEMLTEDQLYELYKKFIGQKSPGTVTIRMPDFVGDKVPDVAALQDLVTSKDGEVLSGSMILLENPDLLFRPHVRAVLRAAAEMGNARILFPQVTNHQNAQELIDFVVSEKKALGIAELGHIDIGMMIEFVRTASDIEKIVALPGVNFLSIGSNDLTSDILGINRYDQSSHNNEYSMCHYDVIRALDTLMQKISELNDLRPAKKGLIDISICGNMPSNPQFIPILIGLGLRKFCVESGVELVNKMVAMLDVKECEALVQEILHHRMQPGEGIYKDFLLPFLEKLTLPEHLKRYLAESEA